MSDFIIYGAASIGSIVTDKLEACHIHIVGYIDKRAYEIKRYNQLPVWTIENVPEMYVGNQTGIFIGVKNVFEHEGIARALAARGFSYIIYKPHNVLLGHGTGVEKYISRLYDTVLQSDSEDIHIEEFPPCPVNENRVLCDYALLEESGADVKAYIPAEFIATNHYTEGGMVKWGDINILAFFTHIDFFRYLDNREYASPMAYLKEYCEYTAALQDRILITDAWKKNVIKNRTQIFEKMDENLNLDPGFFIRNAPEAVWNSEKHLFNLTSGKHRSSFLAAKGMKYIPLKISKGDYERFYHQEAMEHVGCLLSASEADILIPHPCFYRDDRISDRNSYAFVSWFARYYGRKTFYQYGRVTFQHFEVMDCLDDIGYFARFSSRLGCKVHRHGNRSSLEEALNWLFYAEISYGDDGWNCRDTYKIFVTEEKNLDTLAPYISQCNDILIKHCTEDRITDICSIWNLKIIQKISENFEDLERKVTYVLAHTGI